MTKKEHLLYALTTVIITVPCFVIYCLSIENGGILNIPVEMLKIIIPIEFVLAYVSAIFIGSPISMKLVKKILTSKENNSFIKETAIVCATVCVMCPWMSFLATILYNGIFPGLIYNDPSFEFSKFMINFIPLFLQTMVLNFPFALCSQLFFIQPLVRKIFKFFKK